MKDWDIKIFRGVLTGFNDAFIIDGKIKDELVRKSPKSAEIIRPILRGRDIQKYYADFSDLWLLFIPWHFPLHKQKDISGVSEDAEKEFKKQYPEIYSHLEKFKKELSDRNKAETGIRYEWYALQRFGANYWEEFFKPKIIYPNMTKYLPFVYDKGSFFTNQKCFIITGNFLGYLTAFFNSSLFKYCFRENFPELLGGTRELSKIFFDGIPVKPVSEEIENEFLSLITKIQKDKSKNIDTRELELTIEKKLAEIYELSEKELQLISSYRID